MSSQTIRLILFLLIYCFRVDCRQKATKIKLIRIFFSRTDEAFMQFKTKLFSLRGYFKSRI